MPWVRFTADFDFHPPARRGRVVIAYKSGMILLVAQACADMAVTSGKATRTQRPYHGGKRERIEIPKTDG